MLLNSIDQIKGIVPVFLPTGVFAEVLIDQEGNVIIRHIDNSEEVLTQDEFNSLIKGGIEMFFEPSQKIMEEVEETKNYKRSRQMSPKSCKKDSFRTKQVNDKGDKIILCKDKETNKMKVQSILKKKNESNEPQKEILVDTDYGIKDTLLIDDPNEKYRYVIIDQDNEAVSWGDDRQEVIDEYIAFLKKENEYSDCIYDMLARPENVKNAYVKEQLQKYIEEEEGSLEVSESLNEEESSEINKSFKKMAQQIVDNFKAEGYPKSDKYYMDFAKDAIKVFKAVNPGYLVEIGTDNGTLVLTLIDARPVPELDDVDQPEDMPIYQARINSQTHKVKFTDLENSNDMFENIEEESPEVSESNDEIIIDEADKVKSDVLNKIRELYYDDEDLMQYVHVDTKNHDDGRLMVEVRAELGYEGTAQLGDHLDSVIQKYDPDAYFEMYVPGVLQAYLDINSKNESFEVKESDADTFLKNAATQAGFATVQELAKSYPSVQDIMDSTGVIIDKDTQEKAQEIINKMLNEDCKIAAANRLAKIAKKCKDVERRQYAATLLDKMNLGADVKEDVEKLFKEVDKEHKKDEAIERDNNMIKSFTEELKTLLDEINEEFVDTMTCPGDAQMTDINDLDMPQPLADTISTDDNGEVLTIEKVVDKVEDMTNAIVDKLDAIAHELDKEEPIEAPVEEVTLDDETIEDVADEVADEIEDQLEDEATEEELEESLNEDLVDDETYDKVRNILLDVMRGYGWVDIDQLQIYAEDAGIHLSDEELLHVAETCLKYARVYDASQLQNSGLEDIDTAEGKVVVVNTFNTKPYMDVDNYKKYLRDSQYEDLAQTKQEIDKAKQQGKSAEEIKTIIDINSDDEEEKEAAEDYAIDKLTESLLATSKTCQLKDLKK